MRIVIAILWLLLLMAGAWKISRRPNAPHPVPAVVGCLTAQQKKSLPHWVAVRAMPLNWLVRAADLVAPQGGNPSAVTGRYVVCKIAAGDPLVASDLATAPQIPVEKGKLLFPLPLSSRDADILNAGQVVGVFDGTTEVVASGEVAAADCKTACVAWLQLSEPERQLLDRNKDAVWRLISRSVTESKGTP